MTSNEFLVNHYTLLLYVSVLHVSCFVCDHAASPRTLVNADFSTALKCLALQYAYVHVFLVYHYALYTYGMLIFPHARRACPTPLHCVYSV